MKLKFPNPAKVEWSKLWDSDNLDYFDVAKRKPFNWKVAQPRYDETYRPTAEESGLAARMTPSPSNPQIAGWRAAAARPYGGTGTAAGASAAVRAQNRGLASVAKSATGYWQRLMNMAMEFKDAANRIQTTSHDAAFLKGFMSGGGSSGIGMLMGGGMGGGGGSQQSTTGQQYYGGSDDVSLYGDDRLA